jgi:hypothetical protein
MATYPVELPSEHRWAIFHSTSGTMFSPTFLEEDELNAVMFAAYYAGQRSWFTLDEETQTRLALHISMFLDELAPRPAPGQERQLPLAWQQACDPNWNEEEHEEGEKPRFDAYDLLDAFQGNYESRQALFVMDAFASWRAKKSNPPVAPLEPSGRALERATDQLFMHKQS